MIRPAEFIRYGLVVLVLIAVGSLVGLGINGQQLPQSKPNSGVLGASSQAPIVSEPQELFPSGAPTVEQKRPPIQDQTRDPKAAGQTASSSAPPSKTKQQQLQEANLGEQIPTSDAEQPHSPDSSPNTSPKSPSQPILLHRADFYGENWRLPFRAGSRLTLDQAYFGTFSHNDVRALDIQGEGIEIAAARSGTIAAVFSGGKWNQWCNSNQDCINKGGVWRGNHVLINHPDGSQSMYFHMQPDSIPGNIVPGAIVTQGQTLGKMGSTGYTCKDTPNCTIPDPHVHFQVNQNGTSIATPFEDCNYWANPCDSGVPAAFRYYTSINTDPGLTFNRSGSIFYSPVGGSLALDTPVRGSLVSTRGGNGGDLQRWLWVDGLVIGANNWCLEAVADGVPAGLNSRLKVWDCTGRPNQLWDRTGFNQLKLRYTNLCVSGGLSLDSDPTLQACSSDLNQVWLAGPANAADKYFRRGTGTPGLATMP